MFIELPFEIVPDWHINCFECNLVFIGMRITSSLERIITSSKILLEIILIRRIKGDFWWDVKTLFD